MKRIAKKNYYTNELNQHKNEIGKQWEIINKTICHKRHQTETIASITDTNNCSITEKEAIPFLKIAPSMYIYNLLKNLFNFALVRLK